MAPERWDGTDVDGRADVYSASVLLYELLAGRPSFEANSIQGLYVSHTGHPVPPLDPALGVPKSVEGVLRRSMAKQPKDRFDTAADMDRVLELALDGIGPPEPLASFFPARVSRSLGMAVLAGILVAVAVSEREPQHEGFAQCVQRIFFRMALEIRDFGWIHTSQDGPEIFIGSNSGFFHVYADEHQLRKFGLQLFESADPFSGIIGPSMPDSPRTSSHESRH